MTEPIELVLWLRDGQQFKTYMVPDHGYVPLLVPIPVYEPMKWGAIPVDAATHRDVAFTLTVPKADARGMYLLGRRRFHYRELTGWVPLSVQYERDCTPRADVAFDALMAAIDKDRALLEAGAFPGEPPAPYPKLLGLKGIKSYSIEKPWGIE